jgi:hypothetical protein
MNQEEYIQKIKETKQAIKDELINLSFEEKIKRVIEMQKVSKELKKDKSKEIFVWELK